MQIKVFLEENPTIKKPSSTTIVVDRENTRVLPQRKSASKKDKNSMSQPLPVEEEEEESVEVPLIRKPSKKGGTSKARSIVSESIIQRPVLERTPTNRRTGEFFY